MSNDTQAKALADSLLPLIFEALKPAISEHIETQIGGLKKKNTELLDKIAGQKEQQNVSISNKSYAQNTARKMTQSERRHYISRADARNPKLYRQAKEAAAQAGVALRVGSEAEFSDISMYPAKPTLVPVSNGDSND